MNPLLDLFSTKEQEFGLPSGFLARTAEIESSMDPTAQNPNSSAGGLFQFIDSTARQYGLEDRFDPRQATNAAARLARDNARILRGALGREPTAGELYLAHQQGAGGAVNLLRNRNRPAEEVVGRAAARLNRGRGMTAGDFANQWIGKFDNAPMRVSNFPELDGERVPLPPSRDAMLAAQGRSSEPMTAYASLMNQSGGGGSSGFGGFGGGEAPGLMETTALTPPQVGAPRPRFRTGSDDLALAMAGRTPFSGEEDLPAADASNVQGEMQRRADAVPSALLDLGPPFGPPIGEPVSFFAQGPRGGGVEAFEGSPISSGFGGFGGGPSSAMSPDGGEVSRPANEMPSFMRPAMTPVPDRPMARLREQPRPPTRNPHAWADEPRGRRDPLFGGEPIDPDALMAPDAARRSSTPLVDALPGFTPARASNEATMPQNAPLPPPRPENLAASRSAPQQGIDPNQWAGEGWIPPAIGRQLAAGQMGNQADMPAQGAVMAQGGPSGGNLPPPATDGAQGVEPRQGGFLGGLFGGGQQQGGQQGGERQGFMSPAMSDFFGALGASLLSSPGNAPLQNFPQALQALRAASMDREKSQAEQNAISAVLRQLRDPDGNQLIPDDVIAEVRVNPQAAKMLATQAQAMEEQRRARELEAAEVGMFAPPGFDGVGMPQVSPTPAPGAGQPLLGGADQPMPAPGADPAPLPQDLPRGMTPEAQAEIDVIDRELAALDQTEFEYQRRAVTTPGGKAQQEAVLNQIQRLRAARQERRAQLMPAEMPFSDARQVATEFNRETQDHVEVFRRFNEMNKFLNNPSGTSDSQAFNILQRMFDPGMRRPGSESNEPMGTSYLDRAQNAFDLWKDGELATPDLRRELMFAAESYLDGYMRDYANLRAGNEEFVSAYFPGTDPSSIFRARDRQFESVNQALADIPAPGAADDSEQSGIFEQARSFLRRTFGVSDADIDRIPSDSIEAEIRRRQQER